MQTCCRLQQAAVTLPTCRVSCAILACLSGRIEPRVRMLCSLSASLTTAMRSSLVMATNSCCRSRALASARLRVPLAFGQTAVTLEKRVSPSTITLT